jgi:peptide/nickel transport system permease protein
VRFSPGFGIDERQLDPGLSRASQQAILQAYEAERNPLKFYVAFLKRTFSGDLGFSQSLNRPIRQLLADRAPTTIQLMFWGMAAAWLLAAVLTIPPLMWCLPSLGRLCTVLSGVPASLPAAGIALVLFRLGGSAKWAVALVLFPRLYQYFANLAGSSYATPHVLHARARGLSTCQILFRHVLLPVRGQLISLAAISINMAFGAAVAIEAICDLPGLGQLAWKAAVARDLPVLVVLTVLVAITTQVANLAADFARPAMRSEA